MWRNIRPLTSQQMTEFEKAFDYKINPSLRSFIIVHNGGFPCKYADFQTTVTTRRLAQLLDFSDKDSYNGAWQLNKRLQSQLGNKRLIIGYESSENLICVERNYRHQKIVVWSHISGEFEDVPLDIPAFLRAITG